jgi:hypothetical protein
MKQVLSLIALLVTITTSGQDKAFVPFDINNYPSENYYIRTKLYNFSGYVIDVTHTSPNENNKQAGFTCRFWITVKSGDKVIDGRYYADCEALGGCSGIYADKLQHKDYFILTKYGDYNGELLIIDKTGKIQKYAGGIYRISDDSKYLFSNYDSDISGITIFDLSQNKLLFTSESLDNYFTGIYYNEGSYFGVLYKNMEVPGRTAIATLDLKTMKVVRSSVSNKYVKKSKPLATSSLPEGNCQCGTISE